MNTRFTAIVSLAAIILLGLTLSFAQTSGTSSSAASQPNAAKESAMESEVQVTDEEWRKKLTPEEYRILREKGTERAHTGKYNKEKAKGVYNCAACGTKLFTSDTKFDSSCGWPSFFKSLNDNVKYVKDYSAGMLRTEVVCAKCGGHLGHVFDDGPPPTGKRYCINSVSIKLEKARE